MCRDVKEAKQKYERVRPRLVIPMLVRAFFLFAEKVSSLLANWP
jgi:hypothetical protein